jgi:hypothetical protein
MNGDQKFPRWAGPIIGAGLGVFLGFRTMRREGGFDLLLYLTAGGILGALAGCVLWLLDAPKGETRDATGAGSALAILAVFSGVLPFVGFFFSIPAFILNRKVTGWQNGASRLGLGLSVVVTTVVIVASQVPHAVMFGR